MEAMIPKLSGACYAVRLMVHISNIDTVKSIYCAYFHCYKIWKNFLGGESSNIGKIYKTNLSELWSVPNPEPLVEVYLNN